MYPCVFGVVSRGGLVRGAGLGTIIFVTVITPSRGMGEGVVVDVDVDDVDCAEEGGDVVVDELDELDPLEELDELAGEGADTAGDVFGRGIGAVIFGGAGVVGLVTEGRKVGGGGLADTVLGGKIVE